MNRRNFLKLLPRVALGGALFGKGVIDSAIADERPIEDEEKIIGAALEPPTETHSPVKAVTTRSAGYMVGTMSGFGAAADHAGKFVNFCVINSASGMSMPRPK